MKKILYALALVLASLGAQAQTAFPLFQPSNGIMKGDQNTFVTTSAVGSDVTSLFSGTCNAAAFLRGDASCFDLFGTANTFSAQQTFGSTTGQGAVLLSSTTPLYGWNETDGAVDNRRWRIGPTAETWRLEAVNDAVGAASTAILVDRTGITIDSVGVTATAFTFNGNPVSTAVSANPSASLGLAAVNGAATTFMRSDGAPALSQAITPTWTGQHLFTNAGNAGALVAQGARGIYGLFETGVTADNGRWRINADNEQFILETLNDAASSSTPFVTVDRTGGTVDSIAMAATAVTVNGQNVCRANGTGCPGGITGLANPTASVGLTAVNGAATTAMRSDAAPAVDQAIAPTWTGTHLFQGSSPRIRFNATGAGVDEKQWAAQIFSNGSFSLNTRTDADGTGVDAFTISRIGTAANVTAFNAATFQVNATTATNFSNAGSTNTFAGPVVVPNDSWTYAKIQNVSATSRFLGRITAGAGDIEELTGTQATSLLDNFTAAAKGLAPLSGGGTTNFLRADGTWNAPSGASGANPTASVGLAAVNGAAATFMRSDGAPALDQAIAPTWTGAHIFSNAAAIKATGTVGLEIENAAPITVSDETDAPANERAYLWRAVAGDLALSTATDAAPTTAVSNVLLVQRTGTAVDTVNLTATTVQINGNPALGVSPASGTSVGQIVSQQYKGGNTDRSSTTTLTADATLTGLSVPVAGSYLIEGQLCFTAPVAGSGGIKFRYEFTGSISTGLGIYTGNVNGATVSGGGFLALDANQISFATIATTGNCIQFNHTMSATGAGTIDLQWAQNTSDANVTRLSAGSSVIIIRLS